MIYRLEEPFVIWPHSPISGLAGLEQPLMFSHSYGEALLHQQANPYSVQS